VLPLLVIFGTALLLVGQADIAIIRWARHWSVHLDTPATVHLMIFMEMGGCWLLPLVAGVACVRAAEHIVFGAHRRTAAELARSGRPAVLPMQTVFPPVSAPQAADSASRLSQQTGGLAV
jgi:hypothetical protein